MITRKKARVDVQTENHRVASKRAVDGLPFGARARVLPWDVESLCYSFLDLGALSALLLVSHAIQSQVVRRLKSLKTLDIDMKPQLKSWPHLLALSFARKHCTTLRHIRRRDNGDDFSVLWSDPLPTEQDLFETWLRPVIISNSQALASVPAGLVYSHDVLLLLTLCPQLERFEFYRHTQGKTAHDPIPAELFDRITLANLPRLRELTLTTHTAAPPDAEPDAVEELVSDEQAVCILRNGAFTVQLSVLCAHCVLSIAAFPLASLALTVTRPSLLAELSAPHFANLETLKMDFELLDDFAPEQSDWVAILSSFGSTLAKMRSLTRLEMGLVSPYPPSNDASLLKTVRWELPSLTDLYLRERVVIQSRAAQEIWAGDLPHIVAPNLKFLCVFGDNLAINSAVAMALESKTLEAISLRTDEDVPAECTVADKRLVDALRSGFWPELTDLNIGRQISVLPALSAMPSGLQHVEVDMEPLADVDDLCAALWRHRESLVFFSHAPRFLHDESLDTHLIALLAENKQWAASSQCWKALTGSFPALTEMELELSTDRLFRHFRFPALTFLSLFGPYVQLSSIDLVLDACPVLQTFRTASSHFGCWLPREPHANLTSLDLLDGFDQDMADLLELLASFPALETLEFGHSSARRRQTKTSQCAMVAAWIASCGEQGHLQHLRQLQLDTDGAKLTLAQAKRLLAALPRLTELHVRVRSAECVPGVNIDADVHDFIATEGKWRSARFAAE